MILLVRKDLGCKIYSRSESGSRRGKATVTRRMVDKVNPASACRQRLMEQARHGDYVAATLLAEMYHIRIYTPQEIQVYEKTHASRVG